MPAACCATSRAPRRAYTTRDADDEQANIAEYSAQPWRRLPTIRPNVAVRPAGMIRIRSSSKKFVIAVGVLERHRGVHVEEAAAVRPELLDDLLRGDRADGERRLPAGERREVEVRRERLDDALRDEHERADDGDRQQDVEERPDQVGPEVAERARRCEREKPRMTATTHGDADRGGDEVLHRQAGHLREVRERRLARVVLPVRVRHERRRGVERDVPGARRRSPAG